MTGILATGLLPAAVIVWLAVTPLIERRRARQADALRHQTQPPP